MTTAAANQDQARRRDAERRLADAGAALAAALGVTWGVKRAWDLERWRLDLLDGAAALMEAVAANTAAVERLTECIAKQGVRDEPGSV